MIRVRLNMGNIVKRIKYALGWQRGRCPRCGRLYPYNVVPYYGIIYNHCRECVIPLRQTRDGRGKF